MSTSTSEPMVEKARSRGVVHVDDARVRIAVTGDDRFTWLNGVVTCDLKPMIEDAGRSPRAAYGCALNVKGRVLGDVIIVACATELGAWVPRASSASILELWQKYVIMEDCELALDESRALVSIEGQNARALAEVAQIADQAAILDRFGVGGGVVIDLHRERVQLVVQRCTDAGATAIDVDAARALSIETARPTYGIDFDEHVYVQEGGLEERAVSFNKGCYLGQEVVCMLQMRGKVHRRIAQLRVEGATKSGDEVKLAGEAIGHVTSVAVHDDGTATALAMIKSTAAAGSDVEVGGARAKVIADAH